MEGLTQTNQPNPYFVASPDERNYDFGRFVRVLKSRWWVVLLFLLVIGGGAFGTSLLMTPRYSATAKVVYSPANAQLASLAVSTSGISTSLHNLESDALDLTTKTFAAQVAQNLGLQTSADALLKAVTINTLTEVDAIEISASSTSGEEAAKIANSFAQTFVTSRQEAAAKSITEARNLLKVRLDSLPDSEASSAYAVSLRQRYDDLGVLLSMGIGDYRMLETASVPAVPYIPRPWLYLEIGILVGLILGIAGALILDYFDKRVKDQQTLEKLLGVPVIGNIPFVSRRLRNLSSTANPAVGFQQGDGIMLEAMRIVRSNMKALGYGTKNHSVLVTSAVPDEGKTTLAVNLALSLAMSGEMLVLVDCDLRNPNVHKYLNLPNTAGLTNVLTGDASWCEVAQVVDLVDFMPPGMRLETRQTKQAGKPTKFLCVTSGPIPTNPSEILENDVMKQVLVDIGCVSDYVILDGPPLLAVSDSLLLAQQADAVLLASRLGLETVDEVLQVRTLLARVQATLMGVVVSGDKTTRHSGYYHYYRTEHTEDQLAAGAKHSRAHRFGQSESRSQPARL